MTNKEILKKAIKKAEKNGYHTKFSERNSLDKYILFHKYYAIIFDHTFARYFFGIEWNEGDMISTSMSEILAQENIEKWQHHLRQMVLEEKPLLYLKKFLD